jgi:hypothetical protein
MNPLQQIHENFLSIPETRAMLKNIKQKLDESLNVLLTESVLGNMTDSQIRSLAAKAKGIQEIYLYVSTKSDSIGTKQ